MKKPETGRTVVSDNGDWSAYARTVQAKFVLMTVQLRTVRRGGMPRGGVIRYVIGDVSAGAGNYRRRVYSCS